MPQCHKGYGGICNYNTFTQILHRVSLKKRRIPPVRIARSHCLMVKRNPTCTGWDGSKHRSERSYQLVKTPFVIKQYGSHQTWSNYSDLTRPHPKWWFSKENPLISRKPRLVKYINLARIKLDSRRLTQAIMLELASDDLFGCASNLLF